MADVLLSLILTDDLAREVADLLLAHPDVAPGFTAQAVEGHGRRVPLIAAAEQVSGYAPRTEISLAGPEAAMRAVLALIRQNLPRARVFYWLTPVIEMGTL